MHCVADWHRYLAGTLHGGLHGLLAEDVVFYSPIVFTPQRGRELTALYLSAAKQVFPGDDTAEVTSSPLGASFHYRRELMVGHDAVLEFDTVMSGVAVNGVDMIRCNDEGKITEFKVMIRPLKAVTIVHERMRAMLEALGTSAP